MRSISLVAHTLAVALLSWAVPEDLHAETIAVRSGEHDGFTRIVLDLPNPRDWTLDQDNASAKLVLKGARVRFDLSEAFRKIGTGRVSGLRETKDTNTLAIGLNCSCELEAFRLGARMLVIDVKDGTADKFPLSEATAPLQSQQTSHGSASTAKQVTTNPVSPFVQVVQSRRTPLEFSRLAKAETEPLTPAAGATTTDPEDEIAAPDSARKPDGEKRIAEAELRLAEQLGRAVSQGLVTPRAARLPKLKPAASTESEVTRQAELKARPDKSPESPGLNLRVETSADRDFLESLGASAMTQDGETCLSPGELDISTWGGNGSFSQEVGAQRGALVGEFDRPNPDAARKLVRLYLHYGFGAEALLVLNASGFAGGDLKLLQSMGEILEYGHAQTPIMFADQFDCDTPAALWAILAQETIPSTVEINASALLRAINSLPPHLRNLLGPLVSDRLRLARQDDLAAQVLRLVERGNQKPDARIKMARADQQLSEGDVTSASDSLSSVIDANTDLSPKALIKLIESRLSANLPLDKATAELAGAYAQEYRKQPLGSDLKRVHILALSEAGAYDKAFAELSLFASHASPEAIAEIRSHALSALARKGDDQVFLKYALGTADLALPELNATSANSVARRLIALGFSTRANRYLRPDAEGAADRERRLLRAQAALAQTKPRRAEAELLGMSGTEADSLRAQARSMSGDHHAAQLLFATLEQTDRMIEEAWLAGDWSTLRSSGDAFWIDVTDMVVPTASTEQAASGVESGVLARNRALLTESATTRETIASLLGRYPMEDSASSAE